MPVRYEDRPADLSEQLAEQQAEAFLLALTQVAGHRREELPDFRRAQAGEPLPVRREVDPHRPLVILPDGTDPVLIAAAMNPAMSSWLALRQRITFSAGQRVLVLGATGNAGRMAIQVAKHLGASHVEAAWKDAGRRQRIVITPA